MIAALLVVCGVTVVTDAGSKRLAARLGFHVHENRRGGIVRLSIGQAVITWSVLAAGSFGVALWTPAPTLPAAIGLGLTVGGAGANLLDRLHRGAVVDFIAVGPWPAFNLADAAMVVGLALSIASVW